MCVCVLMHAIALRYIRINIVIFTVFTNTIMVAPTVLCAVKESVNPDRISPVHTIHLVACLVFHQHPDPTQQDLMA